MSWSRGAAGKRGGAQAGWGWAHSPPLTGLTDGRCHHRSARLRRRCFLGPPPSEPVQATASDRPCRPAADCTGGCRGRGTLGQNEGRNKRPQKVRHNWQVSHRVNFGWFHAVRCEPRHAVAAAPVQIRQLTGRGRCAWPSCTWLPQSRTSPHKGGRARAAAEVGGLTHRWVREPRVPLRALRRP